MEQKPKAKAKTKTKTNPKKKPKKPKKKKGTKALTDSLQAVSLEEKKEREKSYVLDTVEIAQIPSKGRGYMAHADIKSGTLLVREMAIRSSPFDFHGHIETLPPGASESLIVELCREQKNDPRLKLLHHFPEDEDENGKKITVKSPVKNIADSDWALAASQVRANAIVFGEKPRDAETSSARLHLLPLASFFNHSCAPNAAFALDEEGTGRAVIYAIEDIKEGEEICVCYHTDLLSLPTKMRRKRLTEHQKFTCHCVRCERPKPEGNDVFLTKKLSPMTEKETSDMKKQFRVCMKLRETFNTESEAKTLEKCCVQFLNSTKIHKMHWRMHQVRDASLYATIALLGTEKKQELASKRKKLLLHLLENQIEGQEFLFPKLHPDKLPAFYAYLKYKQLPDTDPTFMLQEEQAPYAPELLPERFRANFQAISEIFTPEKVAKTLKQSTISDLL